ARGLDEEGRAQELVLDLFLREIGGLGKRPEPLQDGAAVARGPGLQLGRDQLTELHEKRRGSAALRLLAQPCHAWALANDLGQDGLLTVVGGHAQLDTVA